MENIRLNEERERDIKTAKWIPIRDYSEIFLINKEDIYPVDIEIYVDLVIRKIAREFKADYDYVKDIIHEENKPFFLAKARFFEENDFYSIRYNSDAEALQNLFRLFYIPITNDESDNVVNVDKVVDLFNALSNMERLEFLNRIKKVSVKVDKIK